MSGKAALSPTCFSAVVSHSSASIACCGCWLAKNSCNASPSKNSPAVSIECAAIGVQLVEDDKVETLSILDDGSIKRALPRHQELDDNEQGQRKEQDGSEIRLVELERLTAEGLTLIERRNAMEFFRDRPPSSSSATPARSGGRAPARWSTTAP